VAVPQTFEIVRPMTKRYALQHKEGERFGDFVIRAGYIAPTVSDLIWHDRVFDEAVHRVFPWPPERFLRTYEKARCGYNPCPQSGSRIPWSLRKVLTTARPPPHF